MFTQNFSLKVEGLYYNLVEKTVTVPGVIDDGLFAGRQGFTNQGAIIRVGLNYHFNWTAPPPVVAKY